MNENRSVRKNESENVSVNAKETVNVNGLSVNELPRSKIDAISPNWRINMQEMARTYSVISKHSFFVLSKNRIHLKIMTNSGYFQQYFKNSRTGRPQDGNLTAASLIDAIITHQINQTALEPPPRDSHRPPFVSLSIFNFHPDLSLLPSNSIHDYNFSRFVH